MNKPSSKAPASSQLQLFGHDPDLAGPEVAPADAPTPESVSETESVRRANALSVTQDYRPWPTRGSAEWNQQQAREEQREKDLKNKIRICNC